MMIVAKLVCYSMLLFAVGSFMYTRVIAGVGDGFYLLSASLWMRSSLEDQMNSDVTAFKSAVSTLLLASRVLFDQTTLYISLGIMLADGGIGGCLRKQVWDDMDANTYTPIRNPWKLPFTMTLVVTDGMWTAAENICVGWIFIAIWTGSPWVIVYYEPETEWKYKVESTFELVSYHASHIRALLRDAYLVQDGLVPRSTMDLSRVP